MKRKKAEQRRHTAWMERNCKTLLDAERAATASSTPPEIDKPTTGAEFTCPGCGLTAALGLFLHGTEMTCPQCGPAPFVAKEPTPEPAPGETQPWDDEEHPDDEFEPEPTEPTLPGVPSESVQVAAQLAADEIVSSLTEPSVTRQHLTATPSSADVVITAAPASEICPQCQQSYVHHQHPGKPLGVISHSTCGCTAPGEVRGRTQHFAALDDAMGFDAPAPESPLAAAVTTSAEAAEFKATLAADEAEPLPPPPSKEG